MNKFFGYKDKGGTLGGEILAGLGMFFLAVCGIFINMQLIAKLRISGEYAASSAQEITINGEIYAQAWFLSMVIAFVGSLLLGLIARLPLVQVGGIGLSTVLISMVGIETGLGYYNLLFVCFVSSVVYTVLAAVPGIRKWIYNALPGPVRKALPAATGLLMAWVAVQLSGIIHIGNSQVSVYGTGTILENVNDTSGLSQIVPFSSYSYGTDAYHPLLLISGLAVLLTFVLYVIFRQRTKRPFLFALLGGTVFFLITYILCVCFNFKNMKFSVDSLWGRLWMVGSEDAMQLHLSKVLGSIKPGRIFSGGMDFSAYTQAGGNVILLFVTGILNFVLINMYQAEAVLQTQAEDIACCDADTDKGLSRTLICNGIVNVAGPIFGAFPVSVSNTSCAAAKDGAKSGLASVIASIGFFISIFVWIVPFLFATVTSYTISFNMYGHYGTVLQLLCETGFAVADAVMVALGLSMAAGCMNINWKCMRESGAFLGTVSGAFLLSNLAAGAAVGTVIYTLTALTEKKVKRKYVHGEEPVSGSENTESCNQETREGQGENSRITIPNIVWAAISVVFLVLAAL